jgi:serine/threonine protein phosphatase PrpC
MLYESSARTHVGTVRRRNEDAVLERADVGLWAVADGAGGHHRGEYASGCVIAALRDLPLAASGRLFFEEIKMTLRQLNRQLRQQAASIDPTALIASTVVAVLISGNQSFCLWAGDSRLYRMRAGDLQQLSRDQSYVQDLVDRGKIGVEAAATHPLANVVCNLIGSSDELVLEERQDELEPGDVLLLCSDGLTRALVDADITDILRNTSVRAAADRLVERALFCSARDNVSAVTIHYTGQDYAPTAPSCGSSP